MTHKNKDKILPVRYNPGKNKLYDWDPAWLVFEKEAATGKKRGPKPKQI